MSDKQNNNSPEIFKWKENEIKQEFEKKWYDWEKVKSELEKIEKKEEIDKKLTELEGKTEDYVNYLEWLLKDKEKLKKSEPEKKWIVEKAVETGKKSVIEEAEKKWGFYWKIAKFFLEWTDEKENDTFFKKVWNGMKVWIWMAILWFFGIKWISTLAESKKEEVKQSVSNAVTTWKEAVVSTAENFGDSVKTAVTDKVDEVKSAVTYKVDEVKTAVTDKVDEGKEIVSWVPEKVSEVVSENMKNKYSSIWLSVLKTFSLHTEDISKNTDTTYLFSKFSNKTFSELENDFKLMDNSWKMNEDWVSEFISKNPGLEEFKDKKQDIYTLLKILLNQKTTWIIFRDNLNQAKIQNLISELWKTKVDNILWEWKFDEIKSKNFDFTNLDMKTNVTLIWLSFGWFVSSSLIEWFESGKNFFYDSLFWNSNIFTEVKEEFEIRKSNLLPPKVLSTIIWENSSISQLWWFERLVQLDKDIKVENLNPEEKEKLEKFLSFKNTVVSELTNENSKFSLWLWIDFVNSVKEIISLKEIIYLYITFDWKSDFLNTSDPSKSGLVYAWLAKSFESNKKTENFFWRYISKIKENIDSWDFFTEEQKLFYDIIMSKAISNWTHIVEKLATQIEWYSRQFLIWQLENMWVPSKYSNELAISIEWAGWILSFFILRKFKKLLLPVGSILWWYLLLFVISLKNDYEKYWLSKENYASVRELTNVALKETNIEVEIKDKNWRKAKIIWDSLETIEQAQENVQAVIEKQIKTTAYILLKDWSIRAVTNYKENNYNPKWLYIKIFPWIIWDYSFEFNWKSYKIDYDIYWDLKNLNPFDWKEKIDFSKFENNFSESNNETEKSLVFWKWSNQKSFTFMEIAKAFSKKPKKTTFLEFEKSHYELWDNIILKEI